MVAETANCLLSENDSRSWSVQLSGNKAFAITSAMGSHPLNPVKVTDLILNMIAKAADKDDAFLLDLAALQEKHINTAKELLGADTKQAKSELTSFTAQLLNDVSNLKSMLQAISIGASCPAAHPCAS